VQYATSNGQRSLRDIPAAPTCLGRAEANGQFKAHRSLFFRVRFDGRRSLGQEDRKAFVVPLLSVLGFLSRLTSKNHRRS
jgi:hypothetical protein